MFSLSTQTLGVQNENPAPRLSVSLAPIDDDFAPCHATLRLATLPLWSTKRQPSANNIIQASFADSESGSLTALTGSSDSDAAFGCLGGFFLGFFAFVSGEFGLT